MHDIILRVNLGARSYPIYIERDLSNLKAALESHVTGARYFIVTDENVVALYKDDITAACPHAPIFVCPAGESAKSFEHYRALCDWLLQNGVTRKSAVIAFGGGVVGDLAGFAAATVMRGVPFVQVPTTLLAQVDSSVGGKTGINAAGGKNLIGCFYQPAFVYAATGSLQTLPWRERRAGYAEILKYALLGDADFFDFLDGHAGDILDGGDEDVLGRAIRQSCEMKADIVAADERESGMRAILNLGHTFGHALEAVAGYQGDLLHGEAVLIGMDMALAYSVKSGLCPQDDLERLRAHYARYDLWPEYKIMAPAAKIVAHMQKDKKILSGQIVLVLLKGIGRAVIDSDRTADSIKDFLENYLKSDIE